MRSVPDNFGDGGSGLSRGQKLRDRSGDFCLTDILRDIHTEAATVAAAQAIGTDERSGVLFVRSDLFGSGTFRWNPDSLINDSTGQLAIRPTTIETTDPGRWDRTDLAFALVVELTFETANDAVLYTMPAGVRLQITGRPFADVGESFVSGDSAALGLSSSNTAYNTAGDLFGGASGSLAAALAAGIRAGTIGAKIASQGLVVLIATDTIKANVLVGTFSAGEAKFYIPVLRV
jgi:hypothetical protein